MNRLGRALLVALFSLGLCASWSSAQELKLAVVDMDAISAQYKALLDEQTALRNWVSERQTFLRAMENFLYVSSEEFAEAGRIYSVPQAQWTDAQKQREATLRKLSEDNERKLLDLQAKPSRTQEEQSAYNMLRDTVDARSRELDAVSQSYNEELGTRRNEVTGRLLDQVQAAIVEIAKTGGYSAVFEKAIVLHFAAPVVDITPDVLKALETKAAAAGGAAPAPAPAPAQAPAPAPAPAPAN